MKKTTIAIAILSACTACVAFADTTTTTPADSSTTTSAPAKASDAAPASTDEKSSGSALDSVKSGWNSFIDLLTGPPNQSK